MRLLWIATKSPWPPADGGRLLLLESLKAISAAGAEISLVAPALPGEISAAAAALSPIARPILIPARRRSRSVALAMSLLGPRPWTLVRHDSAVLRAAVAGQVAAGRFDLVIAEQLQAFAQCAPAATAGIPVLLRAQNVESSLWRQAAAGRRGVARAMLARESRRLALAEGQAMRRAAATVALSREDAALLRALAPAANVELLPPPFPRELPARSSSFAGTPAVVLFGSADWEPNRLAEARFARLTWPRVRERLPGAVLHRFGGAPANDPSIERHPPLAESIEAFAAGSVMVIPLGIASGVRMRLLEAWARGVPVVASPAAAAGLEVEDGRELLLARSDEEQVTAIALLASDSVLRERLAQGGRARLAADHDPEQFARRWLALCAGIGVRGEPAR